MVWDTDYLLLAFLLAWHDLDHLNLKGKYVVFRK